MYMNMNYSTPLWDAVKRHAAHDYYPYHVPGHKGGRGLAGIWDSKFLAYDLTELEGLDNLLDPSGAISEAQDLAAKLFGAEETLFTTNGSSAGLVAAVLTCCPSGTGLVLPRNAHISLLNACIIGDLAPIFVDVEVDPVNNIVLGLDPEKIARAVLSGDSRAVVVIHPNYHGICQDIRPISRICESAGVKLIVDEAHGTHLLFNPTAPRSAVAQGASIVVQSAHKTGFALTGAAWIHVLEQELAASVKANLHLVQSSSPSYLLLSSLDIARMIMETKGHSLFLSARACAEKIRKLLPLYAPPNPYTSDPLRLVVLASDLGLTGYELAKHWLEQGVAVEMSDSETVTLVLSLADDKEAVTRLVAASGVLQVDAKAPRKTSLPLPALGQQVMTPRRAHYAAKGICKLETAVGRVAGAAVTVYPPGVPLLWPGQLITTDIVDFIASQQAQGIRVSGVSSSGDLLVVTEV